MIVIALYYMLFAVSPAQEAARRLSIDRRRLAAGDRVLLVGAGTGLDLDFLPSTVHVTAAVFDKFLNP
jgi:cyclopropane fatty-acyl-phospholipid synthase-like methyltransferase